MKKILFITLAVFGLPVIGALAVEAATTVTKSWYQTDKIEVGLGYVAKTIDESNGVTCYVFSSPGRGGIDCLKI